MGELDKIPTTIVLVASMIAAVTDVTRFRVHNLLTLPLFLSGLIYHSYTAGTPGFAGSLLSATLGFSFLAIFYLMGGVGAGDVKLLTAIGAWLNVELTFYVFIFSALAAGVYALVLILLCGRARETWLGLQIIWHRVRAIGRHLGAEDCVESQVNLADRRRQVIPFAAMMFLGFVLLLAMTWLGTPHRP